MKLVGLCLLISATAAASLNSEQIELEKALWNDRIVVEGDILVLPNEERLASYQYANKWPDKLIPYEIDESAAAFTTSINNAIWHIQNNTCLRFKNDPNEEARVTFILSDGCQSFVGRRGVKQQLELATFCNDRGSVVHELLHAAGFLHEHNRSDRDDHIMVNWDNIRTDAIGSYAKYSEDQNNLLTPYDIDSIMHYGDRNGGLPGLPTMVPKESQERIKGPSEKGKLSELDIEKVKLFYDC